MKKDRNKAKIKEHKKTKGHVPNMQQMSGSLLVFFHLCLVSVPFSTPSILK